MGKSPVVTAFERDTRHVIRCLTKWLLATTSLMAALTIPVAPASAGTSYVVDASNSPHPGLILNSGDSLAVTPAGSISSAGDAVKTSGTVALITHTAQSV